MDTWKGYVLEFAITMMLAVVLCELSSTSLFGNFGVNRNMPFIKWLSTREPRPCTEELAKMPQRRFTAFSIVKPNHRYMPL